MNFDEAIADFDFRGNGITPQGRAVLEAIWAGNGSFSAWAESIYRGDVKAIVDRVAASQVRIPQALTPGETFLSRRQPAEIFEGVDQAVDSIVSSIPGAYAGTPYEENDADRRLPFRTWHVVSHRLSMATFPHIADIRGAEWVYVVDAMGESRHCHAIIELTHPRTAAWLRQALGDSTAHLSSVHSSIPTAKAYLDRQATATREEGARPEHEIFVSSKRIALSYHERRAASAAGELSFYTHMPNSAAWFARRNARNITRSASASEAREQARHEAEGGTGQVFEFDMRSVLHPFSRVAPPGYRGEETIVLLNVPDGWMTADNLAWATAARDVFYTRAPPRAFQIGVRQ